MRRKSISYHAITRWDFSAERDRALYVCEEIGCGLFRIQLMFICEDRSGGLAVRKLIAFDDDTFDKLKQLARDRMATFQELADDAFADLLKKHGIPIDLKDALRKSARLAAEPAKNKPAKNKPAKKTRDKPRPSQKAKS
jgi:hypothetical protein